MNEELFLSEIEQIKDESIKEDLLNLWNIQVKSYDGVVDEKFELANKILNALFNPESMSNDTNIPLSFLNKEIGKLIMSSMTSVNSKLYSVNEVVELTKTEDRPSGYSVQYIIQEIRSGRMKAIKKGNRWFLQHSELKKFLEYKGLNNK